MEDNGPPQRLGQEVRHVLQHDCWSQADCIHIVLLVINLHRIHHQTLGHLFFGFTL